MKKWTLKKNSWHVRLMKFIWGLDYQDFKWLCLYFWFSLFNILFLPIILPVKLVIYLVKLLGAGVDGYIKRMEAEKEEERQAKNVILYSQIILSSISTDEQYWAFLKNLDDVQAWSLISYVWGKNAELSRKLRLLYDRHVALFYINKRKLKEKKSQTNQQRINNIYRVIKPIGTVTLWLIGAGALFLIGWGIYFLCTEATHYFWSKLGLIVLVLTCIIVATFGICFLFASLGENDKIRENISKFFRAIWRWIKLPFKIGAQLISDNCPAINWE